MHPTTGAANQKNNFPTKLWLPPTLTAPKGPFRTTLCENIVLPNRRRKLLCNASSQKSSFILKRRFIHASDTLSVKKLCLRQRRISVFGRNHQSGSSDELYVVTGGSKTRQASNIKQATILPVWAPRSLVKTCSARDAGTSVMPRRESTQTFMWMKTQRSTEEHSVMQCQEGRSRANLD